MLAAVVAAALAALAPQTLVAAGDVASCRSTGDEVTARLLDRLPGTVALLGDSVYETGASAEYARCFSWRRHQRRIRPAVGNHEYGTPDASGYFAYFGAAAGPPHGYYSYELGSWHVVVLNSNCRLAGGCAAGSPQERWLRADLAAHPAGCTLAYAHHPRFSSGLHGSDRTVHPLWQALYDAGADVVLAGHDHHYERFAPLTPAGRIDRVRGIRSFVVGTGGRSHYPLVRALRFSEARTWTTFGVLVLTLRDGGYSWRFVPQPGRAYRDAGGDVCR
jgi:hypothetical protein